MVAVIIILCNDLEEDTVLKLQQHELQEINIMTTRVCVIGAGIAGLTSAYCIQNSIPNVKVTIVADKLSPNTTSDGSGGKWEPHLIHKSQENLIRKWGQLTFDYLLKLFLSPDAKDAGVQLMSGFNFRLDTPETQNPFWKDTVIAYRTLTEQEIKTFKPSAKGGVFFTTLILNSYKYLPWLMEKFQSKGEIKIDIKSKQHCCVPLCTSDARYNPNLNFHHIPKDPDVRKQWIIKIRRDEGTHFKITPSTVVCSKHFKPEDYKSWTPVRKVLNKNAIPSIFDWSKEGNPRRALKRKIVETVSGSLVGDIAIQSSESTSESSDSMTLAIQDNFGSEEQEKDRKIHELLKQLEMKTKECEELRSQLQLEKFGVVRKEKFIQSGRSLVAIVYCRSELFPNDHRSRTRCTNRTMSDQSQQSTCSPRTGLYKVDLMAFGAISRSLSESPVMCPQEAEVPIGHVQFADLMETGVFSFSNTTDIECGSSDFLWDLKHFPVIVTILPSVCCKTESKKWKFAVHFRINTVDVVLLIHINLTEQMRITAFVFSIHQAKYPVANDFDIIINCSGLGAYHLVYAPWLKHFYQDKDNKDLILVLPGADGVVSVGGTNHVGNWDTSVHQEDKDRIWRGALNLVPSLKDARIIDDWVGLRPSRKTIRLESEELKSVSRPVMVIHNYGHSGSGITLCWGCAQDVVELCKEAIHKLSERKSKL
ncbi:hypothetical protein KUTeg_016725 [Tegillarca granosa]|uniref:THAP-type domain-containing protein n=1 Tax=Tegillarca granosa TaxID=220873 RepID=A0ABQ9ES25_TEGGR|nr:hypothetical protein KUTeg_016725 [Tegillarca granosa]